MPFGAEDAVVPTEADRALSRAFDAGYRMDGALAGQLFKASARVFSILELLVEKGVLTDDEIGESLAEVGPRVASELHDTGIYVRVHTDFPDKYDMPEQQAENDVDCENRIHLCQGACCRLQFSLSMQDLDEGVVKWELTDPYMNRKGDDGWCVHQDRTSRACGVYEQRPAVCRAYSCRTDARIWNDFDAYEINPEVLANTNKLRDAEAVYEGDRSVPLPLPVRKR